MLRSTAGLANRPATSGTLELLDTFDGAAAELMLHHGVQPSELKGRVTAALVNASAGLPKLPVLYCGYNTAAVGGPFAGYRLSEKFMAFIHSASALAPVRRQTPDSGTRPMDPYQPQFCAVHAALTPPWFSLPPGSSQPPLASILPDVEQMAPAHVPSLALLCVIARTRSRDSSWLRCSQYHPEGSSKVARLLDAEMLVPFGRALAAEWPFIEQLVRAYVSPAGAQCRQHVCSARELVVCRQQLAEATSLRGRVGAALVAPGPDHDPADQPFGSRDWTYRDWAGLHCMSMQLDLHEANMNQFDMLLAGLTGMDAGLLSHEALENMSRALDQVISQLTAGTNSRAAALHGVPFADAMLASALISLDGEKSSPELSPATPNFPQAVQQRGEQHADIWRFQETFDKSTMQYLLRCPQHVSQLLQAPEPAADDVVLRELALCAASSRGCQLRVCLVPLLSEWDVSGFNGFETVSLV